MEEDYFSDRFVQDRAPASTPKKTFHPVRTRQHLSSLMEESRVLHSSIPLQQSNKGFQLLSKLGYQGGGLGKSSRGTTEPINVIADHVKNDASGIGVNEAKKRKLEEKEETRRQQSNLQHSLMVDFKQNQMRKSFESKSNSILKSCLRIIEELDCRSGCTPFCADIETSTNGDSSEPICEPSVDDAIEVCASSLSKSCSCS